MHECINHIFNPAFGWQTSIDLYSYLTKFLGLSRTEKYFNTELSTILIKDQALKIAQENSFHSSVNSSCYATQ